MSRHLPAISGRHLVRALQRVIHPDTLDEILHQPGLTKDDLTELL